MNRIECPSYAWDRLCRAMEEVENCPVCDKELFDDDGEPLFEAHFPYCSPECKEKDYEREKALAAHEEALLVRDWRQEAELAAMDKTSRLEIERANEAAEAQERASLEADDRWAAEEMEREARLAGWL